MKNIAINGLGRIGRILFKELIKDDSINLVAVNDLCDIEELAHLIKYDTIHGRFQEEIQIDRDNLIVNKKRIKVLSCPNINDLPWKDLEIDVVIECTGLFTKKEDALKHITSGAKHVIISAPGKGDMKTICYGVNEDTLTGKEEVISAASCTTNCLAPVLSLIDKKFKVEMGMMSTVHAYTNDQVNLDVHHKKGHESRRGRACALNIIPSSTGAASAIGKVLPHLEGKISGYAYRVPVGSGSMIDLTLKLKKKVTREDINEVFKRNISDTLNYTEDPIVSSDIIGEKCGAMVDGLSTEVLSTNDGDLVKIVAWYDNEYGYSMQLLRTAKHFLNK